MGDIPKKFSEDFTDWVEKEALDAFQKELKDLINSHSIENECDMPDFLLAEMIINFIVSVGGSIKKNLDWHGCVSVMHPKKET